jgi:hypothetical protein
VVNCSESGNTEHILIPKGEKIIQLRDSVVQEINKRRHATTVSRAVVAYTVDSGTGTSSFSMQHKEEIPRMTRAQTSNIVLNIPHFSMWVTGDLALYADSQGKHNLCSHCCILCLLVRKQWLDEHDKSELWTEEKFEEIRAQLLANPNLDLATRKGVTDIPHYRALDIFMHIGPSLHIQMGMGNTAITEFNEFIDEECEPLSLQEENTRT